MILYMILFCLIKQLDGKIGKYGVLFDTIGWMLNKTFQIFSSFTEKNTTIFVSKKGVNSEDCGKKANPCHDIETAINRTTCNATIMILAEKRLQKFMLSSSIVIFNKSIHVRGIDNMPLLVHKQRSDGFAFFLKSPKESTTLTLQNVAFTSNGMNESACKDQRDVLIKMDNAKILLKNCYIFDVCSVIEFVPSRSVEKAVAVITSTEFSNVCFAVKAGYISNIDLKITNSKVIGCQAGKKFGVSHAISIKCYEQIKVFVEESIFSRFDEGIALIVKSQYQIQVQKSLFTLNIGPSVIVTYTERSVASSFTLISDVQFIKNGGIFSSCIHLVSKHKQRNFIELTKSVFYDNFSETFFGSVYADGVLLKIYKCDFLNNLAGEYHGTIQGFGGAVYVEGETKVTAEFTNFINNTASGFGGTVFSRGTFACVNCSFTGASETRIRPLLGDIVYATAGLYLANTSWKSTIYNEGPKSLIWHPGSPTLESWKISVEGVFEAVCPVGHNLSYSGIERNDNALTKRVVMSCKSCPKNQYSLNYGSIYLYQKNGIVMKRAIDHALCYNCKFGAICQKGSIRPQANYYGFKMHSNDHELKFVPCPVGYCCVGDSCQQYNSCQAKRTGLLCGKCKNGTSENLINSNCAEASECNHHWFWIIYIPIGVCYILAFMYLDKISTFISNQMIWWNKKIHHHDDLNQYEVVDYGMFSSRDPFSQEPSHDDEHEDKEIHHRRSIYTFTTLNNSSTDDQSQSDPEAIEQAVEDNQPKQKRIFHAHVKDRGPDAFTDLLSISFYFYQMFLLIRMQESMVLEYTLKCLRSIYSSFFTLSLEGNSPFIVCPFVGLTPITKLLLVKSFACYILVLLLIFHSIVHIVQFLYLQDLKRKQSIIIFSVRLKVATVQILLVSYATLSTTAVTLVNCITMYDHKVLFIDGTIQCYKWWQTVVFALVLAWVIPFPFVMVASLIHLKKDIITYHQFVLAWAFPLFYLILIVTEYFQGILWKPKTRERKPSEELSQYSSVTEEKLSIEEILFRMECPYKGNKHHRRDEVDLDLDGKDFFEPAIWQGVLIGRRLILILILTFVKSPVLRLYCALFVCILYLVQHIYYRPFVIEMTNIFETTTSVILVMFCSMNLFFAYSYVSDLPPEAADEYLTRIFRWTEAIILVVIPSIVGIALIALVLSRVAIFIFDSCKYGFVTIKSTCINTAT